MGGGQIAVVSIHGLLLLDHGFDRIPETISRVLRLFKTEEWNIGKEVNDKRDHHKEPDAEEADPEEEL